MFAERHFGQGDDLFGKQFVAEMRRQERQRIFGFDIDGAPRRVTRETFLFRSSTVGRARALDDLPLSAASNRSRKIFPSTADRELPSLVAIAAAVLPSAQSRFRSSMRLSDQPPPRIHFGPC